MLFLHGYLSSKEAFTAQIDYFSRFYRVTAIDFLGFGNSAPLPAAYSVGDYAEWTKKVVSALGLEKPHIVAHSFGCRVAVKMVGADNGAFGKLVLTGAAGIVLNRGFVYRAKVKAYRICKRIAPKFAERKFGSEEYRSLSPLQKESYKKIVNEDLRNAARTVQNRTLIVQGKDDTVTPLKAAEIYLENFPYARLRLMDGGHFAFVEAPLTFNLITEEFLYE
ncbi:MAG: alpha/beta hydrolase [Clostridia bacterium]|nr:alpha/beta hydrolase [Clostridia bacterium]